MPNWCDNSATFHHEDSTKIDAIEQELSKENGGELFNTLYPRPTEEEENWYTWNCNNWGCKWDANIIDFDRIDANSIVVYFETPWSPPIALYEYLTEQGYHVEALYAESGMCYCGSFNSDNGEDFYEYDLTVRGSWEDIPEEIVEFANLESHYEWWVEDNQEEENNEG